MKRRPLELPLATHQLGQGQAPAGNPAFDRSEWNVSQSRRFFVGKTAGAHQNEGFALSGGQRMRQASTGRSGMNSMRDMRRCSPVGDPADVPTPKASTINSHRE